MTNKTELYQKAIKKIKEELEDVEGIIPRMATVTSVLKNTMPYYFWCGFYFAEEDKLVIGPYQGTTACANIAYSGVCGTSARKKETIIVSNVHKFPGHIPCDEKSNSEIVVPLIDNEERIIAIFDVDSTEFNSFDTLDDKYLKQILELVLENS